MKPYTVVLQAGVPRQFTIGGELFLLDSAPLGGVSVEFFGAGNLKRDERIEGGVETAYARPEKGFHSLSILSALAQTVRFYVARGDMGVNRFSGSVSGTLGVLAQRLVGGIAALETTERGIVYGAGQGSGAPMLAGGTEQIFAAASNPNGAMLWAAAAMAAASGAAGSVVLTLHAHTVAPAALGIGIIVFGPVGVYAITAAGLIANNGALMRPVFVPAGLGLWWFNSGGATEAKAARSCLYSLL